MIFILLTLFVLLSIVAFFPLEDKLARHLTFFFFGTLLIVTAAFRGDGDFDYSGYVEMFNRQDTFAIEPSFVLISYVIHQFLGGNPIYLFIFYAFFGVSLKLVAIKQLTELWFLSLVVYLSNFFILHEMTQIRAGIASAILLLCIKPIYERDLKRFFILTTVACCFHYSAVIIIPLWFLNLEPRKRWLLLSVPISYVIYFIGINFIMVVPIPGIEEKIIMYQTLRELESTDEIATNVFSFVFLAKVAIFYFLLFKYDLIHSYNKYFPILMKIYSFSLVSYLIFTSIPAFSSRVNELYGIVDIILIPFLLYVFKPAYFSKAIIIFIGLCFLFIALFYSKLIF
jgi:hypothetical protein